MPQTRCFCAAELYPLADVSQKNVPLNGRHTMISARPSPSRSLRIGTSAMPWLPHTADEATCESYWLVDVTQ